MRMLRVVVRGEFDDLTSERRSLLVADQVSHDIFVSSYTTEGTFTYDERVVAFQFRYEVRDSDESGDDEMAERALERAKTQLADMGLAHKRLRAVVTDMGSMWI